MDADVSIDDRLQALANEHRRVLLRELAGESRDEVSVSTLEAVLVRETESTKTQLRTRSEVSTAIRHVHLPRLEDAGLCEYDPEHERVAYVADEFTEALLACIEERTRSNQIY